MTVRAMRMTVVSAALFALVFVHLRLDGVHERQHVLDDRLLLGGQRTVHLVDADARVGVDLVRNTLAGTDVFGLEFLEGTLPLGTVLFDLLRGLILGLLQTTCLAFARLANLIGGLLFPRPAAAGYPGCCWPSSKVHGHGIFLSSREANRNVPTN